jgi:putative hydrolase of HD superfamily
LARLAGVSDPFRVACLGLFHDLPEARTGDHNYVNKRYVKVDERGAIRDLTERLSFAADVVGLLEEYRSGSTAPAQLAHDADQLDLILELKEQSDLGNRHAREWIHFARKRLQTEVGKNISEEIMNTDFNAWWFEGHDHWWEKS